MIQLLTLLFNIITGIAGEILQLLLDFTTAIVPAHRKTELNADFISAGKLLYHNQKGFCLTGKRSLYIEDSFSNALVLGGSGSGKSSCILIPSILKMADGSSLVIHDPSGELFQKTSGALIKMDYVVKVLHYSAPELSERYNPLERAKSTSDIQKISKLVVHNALGQGKDPFWNTSAEGLISLFARYLVNHTSVRYRTLHNVLHLINTFSAAPEKVDRLFVRAGDSLLLTDYKAWVAYGDKTLMSIIATARAALSVFSDPSVAKVTSSDTLDFATFRNVKTALYINNSVKEMRYYSVISAIFFEQFFGEVMNSLPAKKDLPIFFLLDEASSLFLGLLPTAISNIRKYDSGILQIYQHYHQMVDLYGHAQARNIAANCYAKVYLSGQPIEIAQELETTLGEFQFVDDDGIQRTRPLMTADEIRQAKHSIILCGNHAPILGKMVPFYQQRLLKKLTEIPPVQKSHAPSQETPPLIQFDSNETA